MRLRAAVLGPLLLHACWPAPRPPSSPPAASEAPAPTGSEACDERKRLAAEQLDLQLETYDRWQPLLDEHLVWLAQHCPDTNQAHLLQFMSPSLALIAMWKAQADAHPSNATVADNAAVVAWQAKRNEELRRDRRRLEGLGEAARAAFTDGKLELARGYAMQALLHVPLAEKNWNTGNLIYDAHSTLGLLALGADDLASAKRHLLAAGRTPGSPRLGSFGPDMELASALLAAGERDAVIEFLELCKLFWPYAGSSLDEWQREIRDGETSTMPRRR